MQQLDDMLNGDILNEVEPGEDIITLRSANGEDIDFIEIAGIAHEGKFYLILQPVELLEGMEEDEAFVFEVKTKDDGGSEMEIVVDEDIIDAVFAEYGKLYEQAVASGEDN
ncbi:MAG: DUF1292 domain-containing protein [Clostridiales bacterium]|nr:DUF1292 domain-containing protein [Clostridiales bacterium]